VIVLPPGLARRFAAVAARCVSGKPAGPPPPVVCRTTDGELTVVVGLPNGVVLSFTADTDSTSDAVFVVPFDVLTALSQVCEPVALRLTRGLSAEARWTDHTGPRSHPFTALKPGRPHDPMPDIREWVPCPAKVLAALHACGQATVRNAPTPRYALDRLCLSGKGKQVIGSDGKVAFLAGPFPLPFADDKLVPAVPVFGNPELTAQTEVSVGHADGVVAVKAGPWCVRLPVVPGRYPDVAAVIPRSRPSVGGIDEADARELLSRLKGLPAGDDPDLPVTLVLAGGVSVLASDGERTERVKLPRSPAAGPPVRAALSRTALARALKLGCFTVKVWADRPVVFEGGTCTLVAAPLGEDAVVRDGVEAVTPATPPTPPTPATPVEPPTHPALRRNIVKTDPPPRPHPPETPDPLALAESLRQSLADAHAAAAKLVVALRGRRKEQKALAGVYASLKSLNLNGGE
jgi:hypothetical protein